MSKPPKAPSRRTGLPEDPAKLGPWLARWGIPATDDPEHGAEVARFLDHHRQHGKRWVDWSATWRTWCRNAARFAARPGVATGATAGRAGAPAQRGDARPWELPPEHPDHRPRHLFFTPDDRAWYAGHPPPEAAKLHYALRREDGEEVPAMTDDEVRAMGFTPPKRGAR